MHRHHTDHEIGSLPLLFSNAGSRQEYFIQASVTVSIEPTTDKLLFESGEFILNHACS